MDLILSFPALEFAAFEQVIQATRSVPPIAVGLQANAVLAAGAGAL